MKRSSQKIKVILTDVLGVLLMIVAPFLGWLPGPGGIPLFLAGLGLLAINHEWARRWLQDFDKKRLQFTDKYLTKNPVVRWVLDIFSIAAISGGIAILVTQDNLLKRAIGTALISISVIVFLINQKRFDRLVARFKKKH